MSQRLLDWNQQTGVASWWLEDGEGNWAKKSFQHTACSTSKGKRRTTAIPTTARATSAWWRASR